MTINSKVVDELRAMFVDGATPSRLIEHIVARHPEDSNRHALIQEYFREAFGVSLVRGLKPFDDYRHADLRYAFLNQDLLHEMIERQAAWKTDETEAEVPAWLAPLTATGVQELVQKAEAAGIPELGDAWQKFSPREKQVIGRLVAGFNRRTEMVNILARLAERLQQKVNECEDRLADQRAISASSNSGQ